MVLQGVVQAEPDSVVRVGGETSASDLSFRELEEVKDTYQPHVLDICCTARPEPRRASLPQNNLAPSWLHPNVDASKLAGPS